MVWSASGAKVGGLLLGTTRTWKTCVALKEGKPLSATMTLKALLPSCAWVGAHENRPLVGLIVALAAASAPRLKLNWSPSGSLAELVISSVIPTATSASAMGTSDGGLLLWTTSTVKLWVALKGAYRCR